MTSTTLIHSTPLRATLRGHWPNPCPSTLLVTLRFFLIIPPQDPSRFVRLHVVAADSWNPGSLLCFAEVKESEYSKFKEEEALRVDFEGFAKHCVDLVERCQRDEVGLVLIGEEHGVVLEVVEMTAFRELKHLRISLEHADEKRIQEYLWERVKEETRGRVEATQQMSMMEALIKEKNEEVESVRAQLAASRRAIEAERIELASSSDKRRIDAIREARLEVGEDERNRRDRAETRVMELETRLRSMDEDLRRANEACSRADAEATRNVGANDALVLARSELNELRSRVQLFESRAFQESARAARVEETVKSLERELALKDDAAQRSGELLRVERASVERLRLVETEAKAASETNAAKINELELRLESERAEIEQLKSRVQTKNVVIRQQEQVIRERTLELDRLRTVVADAERELGIEHATATDLRLKLEESRVQLTRSAETIEADMRVISFLQRELGEHRTTPSSSYWEGLQTFHPHHTSAS